MGTWEGGGEAKRVSPTLDPGVKDADWAADDGARAVGPITFSITVDAEGRVQGTATGALGDCEVSGQTDGETIRASSRPRAEEPGAMAGTLVVTLAADALEGELRASSADARLVRAASVTLRKR